MRHGIYAHPWDLIDLEAHGGLARIESLGFRDVSLAVTDHGGRMLRPWGGRAVVRELQSGVVHFRPSGDYGCLRPVPSDAVDKAGPSPLERHVESCAAVGLEAWAWARPLRNPRMGDRFRSACVVNAFGDRDVTALCPAQPRVQDYVLQMVDDIAGHAGLYGIELEGLGFADHRRGGRRVHECVPQNRYVDFLMSTCFCEDCCDAMARTGLDPVRLRSHVRDLVRARLATFDVLTAPLRRATHEEVFRQLEADLGNAGMFALWSHRLSVYMRLLTNIRETVQRRCKIGLHVHFHTVFAGDAIGAPLQVVQNHADELLVGHVDEGAEAIRHAWKGQRATKVAIRAAIQPRPPGFRSAEDVWTVREVIRDAGGLGLKVHHLGLLPWPTIERVAAVLRDGAVQRSSEPATR